MTKVIIKLKDEHNGWAIYAPAGYEIALGFETYEDADNHAKEMGWEITHGSNNEKVLKALKRIDANITKHDKNKKQ